MAARKPVGLAVVAVVGESLASLAIVTVIVVAETEALAVGFPAAVVETVAVVEEKVVGTVGAAVGLSARTAAAVVGELVVETAVVVEFVVGTAVVVEFVVGTAVGLEFVVGTAVVAEFVVGTAVEGDFVAGTAVAAVVLAQLLVQIVVVFVVEKVAVLGKIAPPAELLVALLAAVVAALPAVVAVG